MYSEKKYKRNFIVNNNNNKIICTWSSLLNYQFAGHTTGGKSETKLSTLVKTNIFKYCALFCDKVAKVRLQ